MCIVSDNCVVVDDDNDDDDDDNDNDDDDDNDNGRGFRSKAVSDCSGLILLCVVYEVRLTQSSMIIKCVCLPIQWSY